MSCGVVSLNDADDDEQNDADDDDDWNCGTMCESLLASRPRLPGQAQWTLMGPLHEDHHHHHHNQSSSSLSSSSNYEVQPH